MNYDEAVTSKVSLGDAISELAKHGIIADYNDPRSSGTLFDAETGEDIATIKDGLVSGSQVLAWLGY